MTARLIVLHVADNLGSGVASVIRDYALATPEFRHLLLAGWDESCSMKVDLLREVDQLPDLHGGRRARIQQVCEAVVTTKPDVLHGHSSYGGAYARLAGLRGGLAAIAFTPHGYAFYRRDVSRAHRMLYWTAERILTLGGATTIACSPIEVETATRLAHGRGRVHYVPNTASIGQARPRDRRGPQKAILRSHRLRICMAGRLVSQKAPQDFAAIATRAARAGLHADFTWIGGGNADYERVLARSGVRVTGWINRDQALREMSEHDLYIHTSLWESGPISLLEAAHLGIPVLPREIAAIRGLGMTKTWSSLDECIKMIRTAVEDREQFLKEGEKLLRRHLPSEQRQALRKIYRQLAANKTSSP